jgi:hypothetical protein
VDWDGDGQLDILSGCYWTEGAQAGHILLLRGEGDLNFAAATPIRNKDGNPVTNLEIPQADNERITLNICTHQHAVDYEGDGDLDLVVGCFASNFYLHEQQTDGATAGLRSTSQQFGIKSTSHHTSPHLVDWDGDGDLDLLSGSADGGALISHNTGTREKPVWSDFQQLIPPTADREQFASSREDDVRPAPATRIWATDWNHDGELDLLVGDCVTLVRPAKGVSREEFERRRQELDQKIAELAARQSKTSERYVQASEKAKAEGTKVDAKLQAEYDALQEEFGRLRQSKSEFQDSESTGFVWLYLRKPLNEVAATRPAAGR